MRLWHEALIPYLPRQQLLGQHRECCALRGNGWGKPHSVVNYVFRHPFDWLIEYHYSVILEMQNRGFKVDPLWEDSTYRGKNCERWTGIPDAHDYKTRYVYPEHDEAYLQECLANLARKGILIEMEA